MSTYKNWITFLLIAVANICPAWAQADELKGKEYVDYALEHFELVRLTNRRMSRYCVEDNGERTLGAIANNEKKSQVWILEKSGKGYTLQNGETGRYLNDDNDFRQPSLGPTTLYIQYSPNNNATSKWINISESSSFSGKVCLNENDSSPADFYKWEANGDSGSDWTISEVTNFTKQEILDGLLANSKYGEVEDGRVYRLVNLGYSLVAYEKSMGNQVACQEADDSKFGQYWRAMKMGTKYCLQNVQTGRYLRRQKGTLSQVYTTTPSRTTENNAFTFKRTNNPSNIAYNIIDNNNVGLHCDGGKSLVGWYTTDNYCEWGLEVANVSEEEIEANHQNFLDYQTLAQNTNALNATLGKLFADQACTTLKPEIAALNREELEANADFSALPASLQAMVWKVKDNTWQQYTDKNTGYTADFERFFRIADYNVYSNHEEMAKKEYTSMSNSFGRLSNPTGISGQSGDVVNIFVEGPIDSRCKLAVETVTGATSEGQQTTLKAGLNTIMLSDQANLFIFYELKAANKPLADIKPVRIHIEGGRLNGYWDATRGMTNADWKLLQQDLLKESPIINLKTEKLVFLMHTPYVIAAEPNEMEGLMRVWNHMCANEQRYMGLEEFEGKWNNVWNAFSMTSGFMHSTVHGQYYHHDCLHTIMNYYHMTHQSAGEQGGQIWGPSHEMGHNHQNAINIVGGAEATNNMFSNINVFEQGISTSTYRSPMANFELFNNGKHWHHCGIEIKTRLYFQLYLYFHVMKNDTTYIPRLFKALRKNRSQHASGGYDKTLTHGDVTGGNVSYGKDDYLHQAKVMCDVAQADMSELFEAYGMFVPMDKYYVSDYGHYFVTTTQEDIDEARAYMQRYPRKLGNIMFIDDHIAKNQKAVPSKEWESVPAADGIKVNGCTYDGAKMGTAGDVGMYSDYHTTYQNNGYYYSYNAGSRTVRVQGNGAVGFKVYKDGRLVFLSNSKTFTLPREVVNGGFTLVAAEGNGADVVVPRGISMPAVDVYYGGQEEPRLLYTHADFSLPANALAYVREGQKAEATEELLLVPNLVDTLGHATAIAIDGNQPWNCPKEIRADQVSFVKDNTGYAALHLPFAVDKADLPQLQTATYANGEVALTDAERVEAGKPVVVKDNVEIVKTNVTLAPSQFEAQPNIYVLATDGQSAEMSALASPFVFDLSQATGIGRLPFHANSPTSLFDLQGRKLQTTPTAPGIYLVGKKKILVR